MGTAVTGQPSRRRGARKRRASPVPARERILDAAQHLFAARGFDGATIQSIARQARVPAGLVFYYFGRKQALLEQLVAERNALGTLRQALHAGRGLDARTTLIQAGVRILEVCRQPECVLRILLHEAPLHAEVATRFRELWAEGLRLVQTRLATAGGGGSLRPGGYPATLARAFLSTILLAAVYDQPADPQAFAEEIVDTLLSDLQQGASHGVSALPRR